MVGSIRRKVEIKSLVAVTPVSHPRPESKEILAVVDVEEELSGRVVQRAGRSLVVGLVIPCSGRTQARKQIKTSNQLSIGV